MSKRLNRPSPGLACETTWGPRRHQWSLLWQFPCQVRQDGGEGDRDQDSGRLPMAGLQCENNLFYFAKCLTIFGKEYQGYNMKATNPLSFFMFPSCSKDFEFRHEHFSQMPRHILLVNWNQSWKMQKVTKFLKHCSKPMCFLIQFGFSTQTSWLLTLNGWKIRRPWLTGENSSFHWFLRFKSFSLHPCRYLTGEYSKSGL